MITKLVLWLIGLSFLMFGAWALFAPAHFAALIRLGLTEPMAVTELRAFYGGLEIGIGGFFIFSALREELTRPALVVGVFILGSVATARLAGILIDDTAQPLMLALLGSEVFGATVCAWLLKESR